MVEKITYRRAGEADIDVLAAHHRRMFEEMRGQGGLSLQTTCCGPECSSSAETQEERPMDFARLERAHRQKLALQIPDETCIAWIAEQHNKPVGSGGVSLLQAVPVPEDPSVTIGFIHSIFVLPSMRRQGIASTIMDRLLDHCRRAGITRVQLNTSESGRNVYAKKGFRPLEQVMIRWL